MIECVNGILKDEFYLHQTIDNLRHTKRTVKIAFRNTFTQQKMSKHLLLICFIALNYSKSKKITHSLLICYIITTNRVVQQQHPIK